MVWRELFTSGHLGSKTTEGKRSWGSGGVPSRASPCDWTLSTMPHVPKVSPCYTAPNWVLSLLHVSFQSTFKMWITAEISSRLCRRASQRPLVRWTQLEQGLDFGRGDYYAFSHLSCRKSFWAVSAASKLLLFNPSLSIPHYFNL